MQQNIAHQFNISGHETSFCIGLTELQCLCFIYLQSLSTSARKKAFAYGAAHYTLTFWVFFPSISLAIKSHLPSSTENLFGCAWILFFRHRNNLEMSNIRAVATV